MCAPSILVSTGTLVPATPILQKIPRQLTWPLHLPHTLGVGPSPDRFIADAAYGPLKNLRNCWVVPLEWLGLANRNASLEAAKVKLRELLALRPDSSVILVGQSQGALLVAELVLDPEFAGRIVACVMAGGPFRGSPVIDTWYLEWARVFPGVSQMACDAGSLLHLRERIVSDWPPDVVAIVVGSPHDELVPLESAFGVEFPSGTEVREYIIDDTGLAHLRMCSRKSLIEVVKDLRTEFTPLEIAAAQAA